MSRTVGFGTAVALVVANTVGSGIFTTSGFIARDVGSPAWMLALWVAGGAIEFVGVLAYSELSAAMPEAGGEYVYLREAYGSLPAYLSGWTSFFVGFSGAIAAATLAFVGYLDRVVPMVQSNPVSDKLLAIALLAALTAAHIVGMRFGSRLQGILTAATVIGIVALVAAGFLSARGQLAHFSTTAPARGNAAVSLIFVLYAYSGWNAAAYIAGEVRDPGRNLPRALLAGIGVVTALYVAMNVMYVYALPIGAMSGVLAIAEKATVTLFGGGAARIIAAVLALTILNSASAMIIAGPRVYYAMARDKVFPEALGIVNPLFGTPTRAILLQSVWSAILIIYFGTFERVVIYTGFAVAIFTGLSVASLIVLRGRRDLERPFRMPGAPWLPAAYVMVIAWIVVHTMMARPTDTLISAAVLIAGVPLYLLCKALQ